MSEESDGIERELRERFARLRHEEGGAAPEFGASSNSPNPALTTPVAPVVPRLDTLPAWRAILAPG